jgi:hypothetical protein
MALPSLDIVSRAGLVAASRVVPDEGAFILPGLARPFGMVESVGIVCVDGDIGCGMSGDDAGAAGLVDWAYTNVMTPITETAATVATASFAAFMGVLLDSKVEGRHDRVRSP